MKQAHVRPSECGLNLNAKDSVMVPDIVTLKKNQNQISPDRFTPLMLMMLAACGGGGGGGGGKLKVSIAKDVTDDNYTYMLIMENTKLAVSQNHAAFEKIVEKNNHAIEEVAGKSPGKIKISEIDLAPDGKSATFKISYSNPEFSFLSKTVKVELVGDDAENFRMVRLDGLGSSIEFRTAPNYERPRDKDADNVYDFTLKYTFTSDDGSKPEIENYQYSVSVINIQNEPDEEPEILRAISLPENTTNKISFISFTLNRLNGLHKVFFKNGKESEDGSSSTIEMHDKATGHVSEVTVKIIGSDAAAIKFMYGTGLYFRTTPDYEKPADSNGDNIYEFSLVYAGLKSPETTHFRITITDIDEPSLSQGRSNQSIEAFYPNAEYNMPETDDIPTSADII